jgi:hypothetical protein
MAEQEAIKEYMKTIMKDLGKEMVSNQPVSYAFYYYIFTVLWYILIAVTCLCIIWYVLYTSKYIGPVKTKDDVIAEGEGTWGSMETILASGAQIVQRLNQVVTTPEEGATKPIKRKTITKREETATE